MKCIFLYKKKLSNFSLKPLKHVALTLPIIVYKKRFFILNNLLKVRVKPNADCLSGVRKYIFNNIYFEKQPLSHTLPSQPHSPNRFQFLSPLFVWYALEQISTHKFSIFEYLQSYQYSSFPAFLLLRVEQSLSLRSVDRNGL